MQGMQSSNTLALQRDVALLLLQGTTRLTFKIATRGLLGLKNALLTATRGLGLLNTIFDSYR